MDIALGELRARLVRLSSSPVAPHAPAHHHGLRWAWGVLNMISMLPMSPVSYNRYAGRGPYTTRLCEVVPIARSLARSSGSEMRAHWLGVSDALADALMATEGEEQVGCTIPWVTTGTSERRPALFVVRNSPVSCGHSRRAQRVDDLREAVSTASRKLTVCS